MRGFISIVVAAGLAGCGTASNLQHAGTNPWAGNRIANTLTGRAPGTPVACVPRGLAQQSKYDGGTLAIRRGNELYVSTWQDGGCPELERFGNVLVTRSRGSGMCSGDMAQVVNVNTGMVVGSCTFGPFIPYRALRRWQ